MVYIACVILKFYYWCNYFSDMLWVLRANSTLSLYMYLIAVTQSYIYNVDSTTRLLFISIGFLVGLCACSRKFY